MKIAYPSVEIIEISKFMDKRLNLTKLINLWGTVVDDDGEEILKPFHYFYKAKNVYISDDTKRMLKAFNAYDALNKRHDDVYDGIIRFNPAKELDAGDLDPAKMARNFTKATEHLKEWPDTFEGVENPLDYYEPVTVSITPNINWNEGTKYDLVVPDGIPLITRDNATSVFSGDVWKNPAYNITVQHEDPYVEILGFYALSTMVVPKEIVSVHKTTGRDSTYVCTSSDDNGECTNGYFKSATYTTTVIKIHLRKKSYSDISSVVSAFIDDVKAPIEVCFPDYQIGGPGNWFEFNGGVASTVPQCVMLKQFRQFLEERDTFEGKYEVFSNTVDPAIWKTKSITIQRETRRIRSWGYRRTVVNKTIQVHVLRLSALKNNDYTLDYRLDLLGTLDTFVTSVALSNSALLKAAVVIVIATVVGFKMGGPQGAAAGAKLGIASAVLIAILKIAFIVSFTSMLINLGMVIAGAIGDAELSTALGQFQRFSGPLVRVANVITMVAGLGVALQSGPAGIMKGITGIDGMNLQSAIRLANMGMNQYYKYEYKNWEKETEELEREKEALEKELKEYYETQDFMVESLRTEFVPLLRQGSEYDGLYERPYVPWRSRIHTGNMQATTVRAL